MNFNNFVGSDTVKENLLGSLESGRLPHGIVIHGSKGFGKSLFARILACKIINAPKPF